MIQIYTKLFFGRRKKHFLSGDLKNVLPLWGIVSHSFLHESKRLFKFKSIVKLAKTNLNSIREKRSEGKSVLENFRDGSIWFGAAIHSVPADKHAECLQLISHFRTWKPLWYTKPYKGYYFTQICQTCQSIPLTPDNVLTSKW